MKPITFDDLMKLNELLGPAVPQKPRVKAAPVNAVVTAIMEHNGREYEFEDDWDVTIVNRYDPAQNDWFDEDGRHWSSGVWLMWTEGNFNCDCNRSTFCQFEEEIPCGNTITLKKLTASLNGKTYDLPVTGY